MMREPGSQVAPAIARLLILVAIVAALAVVVVAMGPARYARLAAIEQLLLTPWLRPAYLGDGGPALDLLLCNPMGMAINEDGELLISDRGRARRGRVIWRIDSSGIAHLFAGTGRHGDGTATSARAMSFERPEGLAAATDGSVYISDGFNHRVYRVDPGGRVTRVAGTGTKGYSGNGGPGVEARLFRPADLRLDSKGNLFIADVKNHRVRRLDTSGRITTVAGVGEPGFSADGTPASTARLHTPWGLAVDRQDRLIIADSDNHRVRRVEDDGRLVTIAGSGRRGFSGDGGLATDAELDTPEGLVVDPSGRLFIGDELNHAVRRVDLDGTISTVIGTGAPGRAAIGGQARGSSVNDPENVLIMPGGDLVITDGENGRVLRISADGVIHVLAGRGETASCAPRW